MCSVPGLLSIYFLVAVAANALSSDLFIYFLGAAFFFFFCRLFFLAVRHSSSSSFSCDIAIASYFTRAICRWRLGVFYKRYFQEVSREFDEFWVFVCGKNHIRPIYRVEGWLLLIS